MSSQEFDFGHFKSEALKLLYAGKPLTGKDGVLGELIENLLNAALEGEMASHMSDEERDSGNRRNGHMSKQVQSSEGELTIQTSLDRIGSFEPQIEQKRERILAESLAGRIIGMYAIGNTTRDISDALYEQFGNRISAETISAVTDRVLPEAQSWKNRTPDAVYPIVWLDAIHYKVMDDKQCPVNRAIYNVLAIDKSGHKDLFGMYVSNSEGGPL